MENLKLYCPDVIHDSHITHIANSYRETSIPQVQMALVTTLINLIERSLK